MPEFRVIPASEAEKYAKQPNTNKTSENKNINAPRQERDVLPTPASKSQDSLTQYLQEINQFPRLTFSQEKMVFGFIREGKTIDDLRNMERFYEDIEEDDRNKYELAFATSKDIYEFAFYTNLHLVVSVARRFPRTVQQDLIQQGNNSLKRAIELHNPELGNFYPYAYKWVKGAMLGYMRDLSPIKVPSGVRTMINHIRRITSDFEAKNRRKPTEEELHEQLKSVPGYSQNRVRRTVEVMQSGVMYPVSLDVQPKEGEDFTFLDTVADLKVNIEEEAISSIEGNTDVVGAIEIENEAFRKRKRPSGREAAITMGVSIMTAQRRLRRLVEAGLLALHPRDPRNVDASGLTEHTRKQDAMIVALLKEDARLTNNQIAERLSSSDLLGVGLSPLTIERSIVRSVRAGVLPKRREGRPGGIAKDGRDIDQLVGTLLQLDPNLTRKEIVQILSDPEILGRKVAIETIGRSKKRLESAGVNVKRIKKPTKSPTNIDSRAAIRKYLDDHQGQKINMAALGREIGISGERVRQICNQIQQEVAYSTFNHSNIGKAPTREL